MPDYVLTTVFYRKDIDFYLIVVFIQSKDNFLIAKSPFKNYLFG